MVNRTYKNKREKVPENKNLNKDFLLRNIREWCEECWVSKEWYAKCLVESIICERESREQAA